VRRVEQAKRSFIGELTAMIIDINDHRAHFVIQGRKSTHVVPLGMMIDIANGKLKASDVDDLDDFLPQVITEWLENLDAYT